MEDRGVDNSRDNGFTENTSEVPVSLPTMISVACTKGLTKEDYSQHSVVKVSGYTLLHKVEIGLVEIQGSGRRNLEIRLEVLERGENDVVDGVGTGAEITSRLGDSNLGGDQRGGLEVGTGDDGRQRSS